MTTLDVIGGIELTASAAIVVAVISSLMGRGAVQRTTVAALLGGWFALVVVLAATGAWHRERGIGTAGLGVVVALPVAAMWLALMRVDSLHERLDRSALAILVAVHLVRVLGVSFLILRAADRLSAPFAPLAGWGDIIAGIAAIPVAWMVHRQQKFWKTMLLAWNVFGLADLITAIALGALSSPGPMRRIFNEPGTGLMTTLPWMLVPAFIVPLLLTTHLAIFYRLRVAVHPHDQHESQAREKRKVENYIKNIFQYAQTLTTPNQRYSAGSDIPVETPSPADNARRSVN